MTVRPLYPHELITLAGRLAGYDSGPGRPRTIDLRRAVSTAYYGLFHGWTWAAAAALLGGEPDDPRVSVVTRWFTHTDVLELARAVLLAADELTRNKVNVAKHIEPILSKPVGEDLARTCDAFVDLQQQRHNADYDRDYDINRAIATNAVSRAQDALDTLWGLYGERDPNTVLLLRLTAGSTRIARTRA